jgi:hypothetical protein
MLGRRGNVGRRDRKMPSEMFARDEVIGQWEDSATRRQSLLVRFYCADSEGNQLGPDLCFKIFDSLDYFLFACQRGHVLPHLLPPTGVRDLIALGRPVRGTEA